ncbi:MAG: hypothetical protein RDU13_07355 [Elusimicrobiales bacterium]|jgi:hypothetical protein|nr:hypothetical protein [Elusimicrobiales bacterium]
MKRSILFSIAIAMAAAGTAQAQTAREQLFGENPPEIELPEASARVIAGAGDTDSALKNRNLPQPGQNILGRDGFSSRVTAMQSYREVLNALRQMGIKVVESPEGGVYSYLEPNYNGMGSYTKYGYIIEYQGAQVVLDGFSPPKVAMDQWQLDSAVSALKRFKAHIVSSNGNHISYIRYKSKPTLQYTYEFADSRNKAERVKSDTEYNLRSRGFETLFGTIYEDKYYDQNWMGWKYNYHVNVVYLSIVD